MSKGFVFESAIGEFICAIKLTLKENENCCVSMVRKIIAHITPELCLFLP